MSQKKGWESEPGLNGASAVGHVFAETGDGVATRKRDRETK